MRDEMKDVIGKMFQNHRIAIMGIVNVTPDSFSDGGKFHVLDKAIEHCCFLADSGAEIIDIGGESTRPGSKGINAEEEISRVIPVIKEIKAQRPELLISLDTSKVEVAKAGLDNGVHVINDVTAGEQQGMFELVAEFGVPIILMHMRGKPRIMQKNTTYDNVVEEVRDYLIDRAQKAESSGIKRENIFLDPGIGFGKNLDGNLDLLRGLKRLESAGYPILLGTSRKSFLGLITDAPVDKRLGATLASLVPAFELEKAILRVHDVDETVRFRSVMEALRSVNPNTSSVT